MSTAKMTHAQALAALDCASDADPATALASYRKLRRRWHPDVCAEPGAHERFVAVQKAKDRLDNWLNGRPDPAPGGADEEALARAAEAWKTAWKANASAFGGDAAAAQPSAAPPKSSADAHRRERPFATASDPKAAYRAMGEAVSPSNAQSVSAAEAAKIVHRLWTDESAAFKPGSPALRRGPAGSAMKFNVLQAGAATDVCRSFFTSFWESAARALDEGFTPAQTAVALSAEAAEFVSRGWPKGISHAHLQQFSLQAQRALWSRGDPRLPFLLRPLRAELAARKASQALIDRFMLFVSISAPAPAAAGDDAFFWLPAALLGAPAFKSAAQEDEWIQGVRDVAVLGQSIEGFEERQMPLWNPLASAAKPAKNKKAARSAKKDGHKSPGDGGALAPFALRLAEARPRCFGPLAQTGWFNFSHPVYAQLGVDPWAALFALPLAVLSSGAQEWIRASLSAERICERVKSAPETAQKELAHAFEAELLAGGGWADLAPEKLPPALARLALAGPAWKAARKALRPSPLRSLAGAFGGAEKKAQAELLRALGERSLTGANASLQRLAELESDPVALRVGPLPLAQFLALEGLFEPCARDFSRQALELAQTHLGEKIWDALDAGGQPVRSWSQPPAAEVSEPADAEPIAEPIAEPFPQPTAPRARPR